MSHLLSRTGVERDEGSDAQYIPERFEFEAFIALGCRTNLDEVLGVDSSE